MSVASKSCTAAFRPLTAMHPTLNSEISGINVTRLRQELTRRHLPTYGLKPALVERLQPATDSPLLTQRSLPAP